MIMNSKKVPPYRIIFKSLNKKVILMPINWIFAINNVSANVFHLQMFRNLTHVIL